MEAVSLTSNDLWSHVMRCSNDCGGPVPSLDFKLFGSSHIHKFKVPIGAHHQILWFQVPVNDLVRVQMLQDAKDLTD